MRKNRIGKALRLAGSRAGRDQRGPEVLHPLEALDLMQVRRKRQLGNRRGESRQLRLVRRFPERQRKLKVRPLDQPTRIREEVLPQMAKAPVRPNPELRFEQILKPRLKLSSNDCRNHINTSQLQIL